MEIYTLPTGPLAVNTYIIASGDKCAVVDPGGNPENIEKVMNEKGLTPVMIINTHGHFDHIGEVNPLKDKFKIPFLIHEDDVFLLKAASKTAAMYGLPKVDEPKADEYFTDGQVINLNGLDIKVLHTPGHSPGGVCFYIEEGSAVITGDTLFQFSVGRTDFEYGDFKQLEKSIRNKLYVLDDDITVCPGHGSFSSIGAEKNGNPFVSLNC